MAVEHLLLGLMEKLSSASVVEQGLLLGIDSLRKDLHTHFTMVQQRVSGIDERVLLTITFNHKQYLQLLQKLWGVVLDIDDTLDKVSRQLSRGGAFCACQVRSSFILRHLPFRRSFVRKIRQAIAQLQDCYAQTYRIQIPDKCRDVWAPTSSQEAGGSSTGPDKILGRARDMDDIIRMLKADNDTGGLSVLPIVGMAGIGKTTLARQVLGHPWAIEIFGDDRLFINVSHNFDTMIILRNIAEFLTSKQHDVEDSQNLHCLVKDHLSGHRFLLVLDDVWNENPQKWKLLMEVLQNAGRPGSKMIVTTRSPDTAAMISSLRPYTLQRLLPADSERLLTQWVHNPQEMSPRLIPIRRKIAETCGGVPSLLFCASNKLKSIRKTEVAWQHVLNRFDLVFYADTLLLDAAYLSYQRLPSTIQQCFLYSSLFPVHCFNPEQLTDMFIADGPPKQLSNKRKIVCYFTKITREYFYEVQKSPHTGKMIYKMHLGMQLLAQRISRGFHLAIETGKEIVWPSDSARCLSVLVDSKTNKIPIELSHMRSLRTLILLRDEKMLFSDQKCSIIDISEEMCQHLTALRILDMQACRIKSVPQSIDMLSKLSYLNLSENDIEIMPDSISKLRFLAHLNLSRTDVAELPESIGKIQSLQVLDLSHCEKLLRLHKSISNLVNLQMLNLEGCHYLAALPRGMRNMKNLTYLNILECPLLTQMPHPISQLLNLEILPRYIAVENYEHTISELRHLVSLKKLGLHNMENVSTVDARDVILQDKHKLESLTISWTGWSTDPDTSYKAQQVLEHLRPNQGLKMLEILSYPGKNLPSWITNGKPYLKSLIEIKLVNLACESLPQLGQLPHLKIVEISGIDAIRCIDDTFCGNHGTFASLEKLSFVHMPHLEIWVPSEREALFPRLQELAITQCPNFIALHVKLPAVKKLIMLMNNEKLFESRGGLQGLAKNLKSVSISLCEDIFESSGCEVLRELDGLEELQISRCTELTSLPCGMQYLTSLRSLTITECTKLETLPEWLKNFTCLRSLCISGCPLLQTVPKSLNSFVTSLITLSISDCPMLQPVPESSNSFVTSLD